MPTERITDVGFDFGWNVEKVHALQAPVELLQIGELAWHLDVLYQWISPIGVRELRALDVMEHLEDFPYHAERIANADTNFALDIMWYRDRWIMLDGLHRLMKETRAGRRVVKVRKIPTVDIPKIRRT